MRRQLMRRQQHVVGIAEQRGTWEEMSVTADHNPPQLSRVLRPPPQPALSLLLSRPMRGEKAEGRLWLVARPGAEWRHDTVAHYTVEHVVVCSDWRETLSPTCWTSQVLGLDKCRTGLTTRLLHTSKLHGIQNYSLNYSVMSFSLIFVITNIL